MRTFSLSMIALLVLATPLTRADDLPPVAPGDWPMYNLDVLGWRYKAAEKIQSPENAGKLEEKWRFPRKGSKEFVGAIHATPIEQTTDLLNAIHWVQEEKQCDRDRIGLWGSSFSGGKAGYPEPGSPSVGKLKGAPTLEKIGRYAPVEDAARLKGCAALFILAENEELFDNKENGILARSRAPEPKRLVIVPEIKHYGIYREAKKQAQKLAIAWYDEHLKK